MKDSTMQIIMEWLHESRPKKLTYNMFVSVLCSYMQREKVFLHGPHIDKSNFPVIHACFASVFLSASLDVPAALRKALQYIMPYINMHGVKCKCRQYNILSELTLYGAENGVFNSPIREQTEYLFDVKDLLNQGAIKMRTELVPTMDGGLDQRIIDAPFITLSGILLLDDFSIFALPEKNAGGL